ncbi:hypothetical protein ANN_14967, partial [Periplaneta americana]
LRPEARKLSSSLLRANTEKNLHFFRRNLTNAANVRSLSPPLEILKHTHTSTVARGPFVVLCVVVGSANRPICATTSSCIQVSVRDRPYPCKFCGKKFALACNLRAHIKTHHSEGKSNTNKESASEQRGINTAMYDNAEPIKLSITSPTGIIETNCKMYNTWRENSDERAQPILVPA